MKFQKLTLPLVLLAAESASAFPTAEYLTKLIENSDQIVEKRCPFADIKDDIEKTVLKRSVLDTLASPIEVAGEHAFVAPNFALGDQRGPCPGLNALANHGYIPHNGVVTMGDAIAAINQVWGMGIDLATLLAVMGTVWVGDAISLSPSFSIAGETPAMDNLLNNLGGILGTPRGLNASHNFIESDSSPTRDDLYLTGDAWTLNLTKFQNWYDMSTDGTFGMDVMAQFAANRYHESVATNPNFYYGPFTGAIARNAGYIFSGRLFRNHSIENPAGVLTRDVLKSIFAITGPDNALKYNYGHERIPENWYRRPTDFSLVDLNVDLLGFIAQYPELANIGGNMGAVNTFAGVDMSDLSGGIFNTVDLLQGNNLLCLGFEVVKTVSPNALTNIFATIAGPLNLITNAIAAPLLNLTCPAFEDLTYQGQPVWRGLQNEFPGAAKANAAL